MKFLPYILKTLWRHRARTILTVSGSAVALFVFCFVSAVQNSMDDLQRTQAQKHSLVSFQANKFCPATSHLPQDYDRKIAKLPGVKEVLPIQVFTNNCRASLDVVVFYGVPAEKLQTARDFKLLSGDWAQFERQQNGALVGRGVARRRGKEVNDSFSIGDITVNVAGIYSSSDEAEENYVYCHLDFLQRSKGWGRVGTVTQFEVLLTPEVDADRTCKQIDDLFRGGPVATDTRPKGVFQANSLADLVQLISMARYLGYACVGLVLALVATTTVMAVQDRVKEHAVLQTIGFSGARIFRIVLSESVLLSVLGGFVGVILAQADLTFFPLSISAEGVSIVVSPSLAAALTGLAVSLLAGLLAGLAPAWHAARTEIVPALREA